MHKNVFLNHWHSKINHLIKQHDCNNHRKINYFMERGKERETVSYLLVKRCFHNTNPEKTVIDPLDLINYQPISNLPFILKIPEWTVAPQLQAHLHSNNLYEPFQSGSCSKHSSESALV